MSELLLAPSKPQARLCQNLQDTPLGGTAWNRLLQRSETRSVFLTWQWLSTWWEAFRTGAELYTFAVLDGEQLIGIAPLMLRRDADVRVVEFLGMGSSDYCDLIAAGEDKPAVLAAVMEALLRRRDRWDRIRLRNLPEQSSTVAVLSQLELPVDLDIVAEVESVCPALSIETSPHFARTCAHKKSLVRHERYFERLSPLAWQHAMDLDEVRDLLPEFMEQHRDRRFMAGDRSLFDDPRHRRFYERLVQPLLDANWLRFSVLRWRDEILAFHLGFLFDRVYTWYKPTFNVDYARFSPGEVLLKKLIEHALQEDVRELDFTIGDEAFKERFTNVKRNNLRVQIIQKGRTPARRKVRESLQRTIKAHNPALYARIKGLVQGAQAFRARVAPVDEPAEVASGAETSPIAPHATFVPTAIDTAPRFRHPRLGWSRRVLWRVAPVTPRASEFRVQWARYSQIKTLARREALKPAFLMRCLARIRGGERVAVVLWHERPVALVWLARDAQEILGAARLATPLPEQAALVAEFTLAADVLASQQRENLVPALLTFLAAEGVTALYGVEERGGTVPLPRQCGQRVEPVLQCTEVGTLFGSVCLRKTLARGQDGGGS